MIIFCEQAIQQKYSIRNITQKYEGISTRLDLEFCTNRRNKIYVPQFYNGINQQNKRDELGSTLL